MSNTPRTDALAQGMIDRPMSYDGIAVWDHAKTLERELDAERKAMNGVTTNAYQMFMDCGIARQRAESAEAKLAAAQQYSKLYLAEVAISQALRDSNQRLRDELERERRL